MANQGDTRRIPRSPGLTKWESMKEIRPNAQVTEAWLASQLRAVKVRKRETMLPRSASKVEYDMSEHGRKQDAKKMTLGAPYSPITEDYEQHGLVNQIKLGEDVWSAALLAWLVVPWEIKDTSWGWVSFMIPPQIALAISSLCQLVIICFVTDSLEQMAKDGRTCEGTNPMLRFVAVCVFLAYGTGTEILEALSTNRWISAFPDWDEDRDSAVIAEVKQRGGHLFTAILCRQDATDCDGFSAIVPAIGLTRRFKWFARFFYVFFRIILSTIIMVEASGIILYSLDNLSVITGTIMAKYILEIDDYLYGALITAFMKNDIRAIPPIGVSPSIGMTNADTVWQYWGSYILVVALLAAAQSLHSGWCDKAVMGAWLGFGIPMLALMGYLAVQAKMRTWNSNDPLEYRSWPRADDKGSGAFLDEEMGASTEEEEHAPPMSTAADAEKESGGEEGEESCWSF